MLEVTAATLSNQLWELEREALISRHAIGGNPPKAEHPLTEIGKSFCPVLESIGEFGKNCIDGMKPARPPE